VFLAHHMVIATDVPRVIISVIRVCSHAPKATRYALPNSDAVFFFNKHRTVLSHVKGIVEFSDIRSNQVAAEFRWGVRIHRQVLLSHLRTDRRAPYPRPREEKPLQSSEFAACEFLRAIFDLKRCLLSVHIQPLVFTVQAVSNHGDTQSAQVTDIFTQGELTVDALRFNAGVLEYRRNLTIELLDRLGRELLKCSAVLIRPPRVQVSIAVVLRSLIIEAVTNFVTDDRADRTEVLRRISLWVIKRWAQNCRWEGDVIDHWVVESVHRLRGAKPFIAVGRFANLIELKIMRPGITVAKIFNKICARRRKLQS